MNQEERRLFLIKELLKEQEENGMFHDKKMKIPDGEQEQRYLLRGLLNVRLPKELGDDFLRIQDEYLSERRKERGIVKLEDCIEQKEGLYLWQGDITRLEVDAIVNAANSGMTGCYQPNHACIDNCIHTYAGAQLRLVCADMMRRQGHEEETGQAKITPAYNLPSKYILHTVGPIVNGKLNDRHCRQLESCYRSCLALADKNNCNSIAFCCISTGVFGFPQKEAAKIAVQTVKDYKEHNKSKIKVVYNVWKDEDYAIYKKLLEKNSI